MNVYIHSFYYIIWNKAITYTLSMVCLKMSVIFMSTVHYWQCLVKYKVLHCNKLSPQVVLCRGQQQAKHINLKQYETKWWKSIQDILYNITDTSSINCIVMFT